LNHSNVPYENGFLDFAIDQDVNLTYQDTFSTTVTWVGSAHGFSNITENNILVIATVSDENWQWGYANPPHANPFHMYKGQAAAMALPGETGHDDHSGSYTHTVFVEEATATW